MIFFSSKTIERECLAPAKMLAPLTCLKPQRKQIIGARHFHLCLLRIKLTHNVPSGVASCHLECGPPPNSKCGSISSIHDKPIRSKKPILSYHRIRRAFLLFIMPIVGKTNFDSSSLAYCVARDLFTFLKISMATKLESKAGRCCLALVGFRPQATPGGLERCRRPWTSPSPCRSQRESALHMVHAFDLVTPRFLEHSLSAPSCNPNMQHSSVNTFS